LEFCTRTDPRYQSIRKRHYVVNRGTQGQQAHFLIWYNKKIVGIMAAGSAVYTTAARDDFFGITKERRHQLLPGIVDNLLFRLERHEPNLATRCLALWRRTVEMLWLDLYSVRVFGFETFIDDVREGGGVRDGALYRADNWFFQGVSSGNTKHHGREGLTGGLIGTPHVRRIVPKKLIFTRWVDAIQFPIEVDYHSSWRSITPQEKAQAKRLATKRKTYIGMNFFLAGRRVKIF
jgi:hypothetical protein